MSGLPSYDNTRREGPINFPYVSKARVGSDWDYLAHAKLARALIVRQGDRRQMSFEEDAMLYEECARQATLMAVRRTSYLVEGDPGRMVTRLVERGEDVREGLKAEVSYALDRADTAVRSYFRDAAPEDELETQLINEIIAARQTKKIANVHRRAARQ